MHNVFGADRDDTFVSRDLTVFILTFNESQHIERAIRSAQRVAAEVLVVDAFSADDTVSRAQRLGARVIQHAWTNHATQVNWAITHGDIRSDWIMRLDADEFLDDELATGLSVALRAAHDGIAGFDINRRIRFLGHDIRHGGMSPLWVTRIWRNGQARCEARRMDEHMMLTTGTTGRLRGLIIDENLNSLSWWTQKHNRYASHEAIELLRRNAAPPTADEEGAGLNPQARRKRLLKNRVYARLPLGMRAWLYFLYRVVLRLGFLDGARGMIFHTLQGLWYRLLVDAKIAEVNARMARDGCVLEEAVRRALLEPDTAPAAAQRRS